MSNIKKDFNLSERDKKAGLFIQCVVKPLALAMEI